MKNKVKIIIIDYLFVIVGTFLLALGMNSFLVPVQLSSGGVGTIGTIFYHLFNIPLSVTTLVLNIVLFALGFRFLNKGALIKTAFGILLFSGFLELVRLLPAFNEDLLVCVICGGVLVGIGVGLVIRADGSTGGSDFLGLIIKRFMPHIPVGTVILVIDCIIIGVSGIVFRSYVVTFYSIIALYISARLTNFITVIGNEAKSIYIISNNIGRIKAVILEKFQRGATEIYSRGAYSGKEGQMLFCVVSPKEAPRLVKEIKAIDKNAFIIIFDAREVLGEGFKAI